VRGGKDGDRAGGGVSIDTDLAGENDRNTLVARLVQQLQVQSKDLLQDEQQVRDYFRDSHAGCCWGDPYVNLTWKAR